MSEETASWVWIIEVKIDVIINDGIVERTMSWRMDRKHWTQCSTRSHKPLCEEHCWQTVPLIYRYICVPLRLRFARFSDAVCFYVISWQRALSLDYILHQTIVYPSTVYLSSTFRETTALKSTWNGRRW